MKTLCKIALLLLPLPVMGQATCNQSDVQSAITAASEGGTVTIPAGTCTWTTGVTISGKGLTVTGAGSGRIVAYDAGIANVTVGTGTKTWTIAGFSPGFSGSSLTGSITAYATGNEAESMSCTVTSYSAPTLTMSCSSFTGSGSQHRWFFATPSSTVLINNSSTAMFSVTEDATVNTKLSGFKIQPGTGSGDGVDFNYGGASAQAIVLQNCWIPQGTGDSTHFTVDRGVISNCSFDSPTFSMAPIAVHIKIDSPATGQDAWQAASFWGTADTTGQHNIYIETSDFEAYLNATDVDDNGRLVFRHNLMNNAGFGTHGADTSNYGQRYFEYYNNTGVFNGYADGSTFNMTWWMFVRGGSFVVHDNVLPDINSTDFPNKATINYTVMNLQRNAGPDGCWGSGGTPGQYYHAPRQVGFGRVTGSGTVFYPPIVTPANANDSVTYAGDSEPAYVWNNQNQSGLNQPLDNVGPSDFGAGGCTFPDSTSNYVVLNRDLFNGSTAKPGYTPYTYPHPLVGGTPQVATPTFSPVAGTYGSTQSVTISTSTGGATLCYTTDGSTPTANGAGTCTHGTTYSTPVSVSTSQTLKAVGSESSFTDSTVGSAAYVITTTFTWTPTIVGNGSLTGTNCSSGSYASGTTIGACTASAGTGYTFSVWSAVSGSAGCSGSTNPCPSFSLTANSAATATFTVNSYTLSTATAGTGTGTVTGCAGAHNFAASYSCTVTPTGGSTLASVSGCGGSGTTTYTGTMPASNCTVTATFNAPAPPPPVNFSGKVSISGKVLIQ